VWSVPACRRAGCVSAVPGCVSWDLREAVARSWKNSKLPVLTHLRRSAGRYRASKNSPGQLQKQATNVTCLTPVPGGARQTSSGEQAGHAGPMPRYRSETGRRSACRPTRTTTTRTAAGAALGEAFRHNPGEPVWMAKLAGGKAHRQTACRWRPGRLARSRAAKRVRGQSSRHFALAGSARTSDSLAVCPISSFCVGTLRQQSSLRPERSR